MASEFPKLNRPLLVAAWPGMGGVAINAGVYLLAKLGMEMIGEIQTGEIFDVEHVEVRKGIIRTGRRPRNRFFLWRAPETGHDLVVFLGEAQPSQGKYAFCRQLIAVAKQLGVERVFTFAAMGTDMHPSAPSRVFAAATDARSLEELRQLELHVLEDGHIGGLNGVLLGVAGEEHLRGVCLLGEMPSLFHQLPFPKASLAVLRIFVQIAGLEVDMQELTEQAEVSEKQLSELLEQMQRAASEAQTEEDEEMDEPEEEEFRVAPEDEPVDAEDRQKIERLFGQASSDRSKAFELKRELDRLGVFKNYEDRFLDLFKKSE
jgi:proteasome assembly chaperone (PAC2) family protein